ncbi:MAG TPA: FAD-binding oxidoreductase [Flavobacteriaceae bacterium]|jgi:FAD/FMN-containing dehydrogenase|nr:FAD-binding oxidoreductase [Flavobacteriaceae bacterium]|tara:strand:+ start:3917 stop:5296 length:1380 start_codon:yes stop_codon:yes gene_type:complete
MDIIKKFRNVIDDTSIIKGNDLKSRFYHIWKTDISLESICVLLPRNTKQVSEIMKICYKNDQEVVIHGGLTNLVGATKSNNSQVVISLEKMDKIIEIDKESKTLTCESGVILGDLINACEENDLLLPLNFGARGSAQIGGAVSTNAGGLRVFKYGMTRNLVLGTEAVLPNGKVISSLKKLIKDNSGYDLKQIFIGSEGTLGIVTKVVLRLYELPSSRLTALSGLNSYDNVLRLLKHLEKNLAGNLSGFELLWNETYKTMVSEKTKYNKYLPDTHKYYVFIESTGSDYENDYSKLEDIISDSLEKGYIEDAVIGKNDKEQRNIWGIREDVSVLADERKHDQHFDISIPTSSIGVVIDKITTELKKNENVKTIFPFGHVADGNIHFIIGKDSGEDSITKEVNKIIYSNIESVNGSISAEHGIGLDKKEYLKCTRNKEEIELMKLLKKSIDPKNILNPGRIL